jgi:hypothetical protein
MIGKQDKDVGLCGITDPSIFGYFVGLLQYHGFVERNPTYKGGSFAYVYWFAGEALFICFK